MSWRTEWKKLAGIAGVFAICFWLPTDSSRFNQAVGEGLALTRWYAREHVILCLLPAFFIAGAIGVFVSQGSVMRYLGPRAPKPLAYSVASVSGVILAVCSCTVLPLFAGIWRMGAGLGPATAFLYSGPAINVLAIVLTARVLGLELGAARAVGAVVFSVVIGLLMHLIYRKQEQVKADAAFAAPEPEVERPLWQNVLYFASMVGILVFANWGRPPETSGVWYAIYASRWWITSGLAMALGLMLVMWFSLKWWQVALAAVVTGALALMFHEMPMVAFLAGVVGLSIITIRQGGEAGKWFETTWMFARQILPLLLLGVLASGFLLGRPGHEGVIPATWVSQSLGGNSLGANVFASVAGALMYFATLTEVPILQGLLGSGMGKGPALALLLAGPAISLPNLLVLRSIMGTQKTLVYVSLVVVMATMSGLIYGAWF